MNQPYRLLGLGLLLAGVIFAPVSYFILNSPALTAMGISLLVLGFTCIALANTRPYISPEACRVMLRTGMENTAALLKELGLRNKAIYLPSLLRDGPPQAVVPLADFPLAVILFVKCPFVHLFGATRHLLLLQLKGGTLARGLKGQMTLHSLPGIV